MTIGKFDSTPAGDTTPQKSPASQFTEEYAKLNEETTPVGTYDDLSLDAVITSLVRLKEIHGGETPIDAYLGDPREGGGLPLLIGAVGPVDAHNNETGETHVRIMIAVFPDMGAKFA